ncbi:hypothetical protein DPSP01_000976 [Paraphaeosphaeria sporulosa]|uniref:Uncharacterized protein n=1 Tax=Paraphaeosphaeria sporulosa TaxID=1460663 RepID=A0A177C601_9PLEO|nr:uncharacterized protein CC84DRAFT_1003550 [Paraphaeosphaeria sporulosa]OAG02157.1 hypothetical protein CC84DRAFT_1003550 [Paraphaeosphaeria sporulosa]
MPLTWKETRPGRWERPQSCLEKVNLLNRNVDKALDRDNWAKTAVAKVEFDPKLGDPVQALKTAWKQVRYNYPEVAAFPYNGTYMYRIGNPEQIQLWVSATFVVEHNTTIDELFGHLPRNEQMMCYYLPDTSEILVRSPHYRLDARGAIFILNYLIKSLANPDPVLIFGGCAGNLSPSIDDALNIPFEYTPKIEEAATRRMASLNAHNPLIELTPNAKPNRAGATRRRFLKFSEAETKSITKGAKSAGMDYTAAMHAAVIAAVVRLAPPTEVQSYMASFHCDLRYLIPKSSKTKAAPIVCTDAITTEIEVSPSTNLKSYYNQLAPVYANGYAPYLESSACFHDKLAKEKYADGKGYESTDGQAQPRLGPLGIIDDQLTKHVKGVVRVKDFWLGGETLTKRKMVHNWIWEDQMTFSCCYNEKYWDDQFVELFLQTIKSVLMEEVAKTSSSSLSSKLKGMMLK